MQIYFVLLEKNKTFILSRWHELIVWSTKRFIRIDRHNQTIKYSKIYFNILFLSDHEQRIHTIYTCQNLINTTSTKNDQLCYRQNKKKSNGFSATSVLNLRRDRDATCHFPSLIPRPNLSLSLILNNCMLWW